MKKLKVFNNLPFWCVPDIFSWQHILLIIIMIVYVIFFARLIKKSKHSDLILKLVAISTLFVFSFRLLFGYDSLIYTPKSERVGFWFKTLLPLELCNLGIFILIISAFTKKRFWYVVSIYVTLLGGITAFIAFPYSHRYPRSTIINFQFFDYYYIHAQLVAIPISYIFTKRYKVEYKDTILATLSLAIIALFLLVVSIFLNFIFNDTVANYMWVMGDEQIPLLRDLFDLIPIPLIYMLPLTPLVIALFLGLTAIIKYFEKNSFNHFKKYFKKLFKKNQ